MGEPTKPVSGNVLVTGATGFVGLALVPHLVAAGYAVTAVVRDAARLGPLAALPGVTALEVPDITRPEDWPDAFRQAIAASDACVHLAGTAHASPTTPDELYERDFLATRALADAVREAGRHMVYMSSVRAQSGPVNASVLDEAVIPEPTDPYGQWKLKAESTVLNDGPSAAVLRPVLVYGPGVKGNMAALLRLARLPMPLPFGAFTARRSLVSVDNLCAATEFALRHRTPPGTNDPQRVYLVADPGPAPTVADIVGDLRVALDQSPRLFSVSPAMLRSAAALLGKADLVDRLNGSLEVDASKLWSVGFTPPHTRAEGFRAMVEAAVGD